MNNFKKDPLLERLNLLLEESLESIRQREQTTFDHLLDEGKEVLIFGAGGLGRNALHQLIKNGYSVRGFIDNNALLHGATIIGIPVFSAIQAWSLFGNAVGIVVAIYFGQAVDSMGERIAPLRAVGFKKIAHIGHFAWKHPENFLPLYSLDLPSNLPLQKESIAKAYHLFPDVDSRRWYVDHVEWRYTLNFDLLPKPVLETIYFHERFLRPCTEEFLIDGGAFTGDTLKSFADGFGKTGFFKVLCFEPDPTNFPSLKTMADSLDFLPERVEVYPYALGNEVSEIMVESTGGPGSRVGHGEIKIQCRMIDEFHEGEHWPTFIKLDIEGYELPALQGAVRTIKNHAPVLAVSAYHKQNDLWELPLALAAMQPGYSFRLAPHVYDGWDLVLYVALPSRFMDGNNN